MGGSWESDGVPEEDRKGQALFVRGVWRLRQWQSLSSSSHRRNFVLDALCAPKGSHIVSRISREYPQQSLTDNVTSCKSVWAFALCPTGSPALLLTSDHPQTHGAGTGREPRHQGRGRERSSLRLHSQQRNIPTERKTPKATVCLLTMCPTIVVGPTDAFLPLAFIHPPYKDPFQTLLRP